ncbi:hypothetical protein [Exilibacterium tricleocarpae]|uniref:hypothetical protein n=1 Tax=Exilibacterium tricleocarpae TaxID=2591008 RepID=UPI0015D2AE88|nr:hypothetical protein [Exilibacterium tricleocarpae]
MLFTSQGCGQSNCAVRNGNAAASSGADGVEQVAGFNLRGTAPGLRRVARRRDTAPATA